METVAIGIYVTEATGQAAWTGAVAAAGFVPIALLGPLGGALADRFPRRLLLMTTTLVQIALAALLTVLFVVGDTVGAGRHADRVRQRHRVRARLPRVPGDAPRPRARARTSRRDRAVVGAVQPRPGRRPGARRRRHRPRRLLVGARASTPRASSRSSFVLTHAPPPAAGTAARRRDAVALDGRRFALRARATAGCASASAAMCLNTLLAAPFIALVPAMAEKVFDAGAARHVDPRDRAGHRRGARWASRSGRSRRGSGSRRVVGRDARRCCRPRSCVYAYAPALPSRRVALFFVGALYLGALSSFFTIVAAARARRTSAAGCSR